MAKVIEITPEIEAYRKEVAEVPYVSSKLTLAKPIELSSGDVLEGVEIAYDTWGTLNDDKSNVILIEHALSGNSHAADAYRKGRFAEGWWNRMVGPGKAIDTRKYYVICTNVIGGCSGSTGPSSIIPGTDRCYAMDFPVLLVKDMVDAQKAFLDQLGIEKIEAVVGGSLGGMQALVWAKRYPEMVEKCIAVATTWRTSAQSIAFDEVGRRAIINDPKFNDGHYSKDDPPAHGLAIARMIGHITYLCDESMTRKFGRTLIGDNIDFTMKKDFQVESYLEHQGYKFVERFDANTYLYITRAIDYFSLSHSLEGVTKRFKGTKTKFLLLSYSTDWLFTTSQMRELSDALVRAGAHVTFAELSYPFGHDSFLLEEDVQARYFKAFLEGGEDDR